MSEQLKVVACAVKIHPDDVTAFIGYPPARHHQIVHCLSIEFEGIPSDTYIQGFVLSDDTFVTREQALPIAKAAGQIIKWGSDDDTQLFSINLW